MPRIDCGDARGFERALGSYISCHRPVILERLGIMPAAAKWSIEYLKEHTTEWPGMNVLRSHGSDNRYLYYMPEQADRDMSEFQAAPRHASTDFATSFSGFLRRTAADPNARYYLQAPLVLRQQAMLPSENGGATALQETWSRGIDSELRADCDERLNRHRLQALQTAGNFGHWSRSQLFVGPSESLSPCHYDQYDNIFLQVAGHKHILLFEPGAAEGLYPFPVAHPYDEYAMLDLERVDVAAYPRARETLQGSGLSATLGPGDYLYIPTHWWHHVQGSSPPGRPWSISVNFWFSIEGQLMQKPPHPLPPHLELELARHVEFLLADVCGSSRVASFARLLRSDSCAEAAEDEPSGMDDVISLPARNFILFRLARILGPENVCNFVQQYFPQQRFERSVVLRALASKA